MCSAKSWCIIKKFEFLSYLRVNDQSEEKENKHLLYTMKAGLAIEKKSLHNKTVSQNELLMHQMDLLSQI